MHKLFFWLNWRAGDLALTRPLVRRVLDQHDVQIAYGCWQNQAYIVEDLPVRIYVDPRHDPPSHLTPDSLLHLCPPGHLPIYLWAGLYPDTLHHTWESMLTLYNRQVRAAGMDELAIEGHFVPMLDFPPVEVAVADGGVFLENGIARSKHSDFEFDVLGLAQEFPELHFYCTATPNGTRSNIIDCSSFNLRVLSSISNRCLAIVGKGSGPFCSTLTEANRYKPRAILRYHPLNAGHSLWDYPGNPMQYLETHDDLRRFLATVLDRPRLTLLPRTTPALLSPEQVAVPEECEAAAIDLLLDQAGRQLNDREYLIALTHARNRLMQFWNSLAGTKIEYAYRGAWGKLVARFLKLGVWNLSPLTGIAAEELVAPSPSSEASMEEAVGYSAAFLRYLISAMLVLSPQELPFTIDFRRLPDWLRPDFLRFVVQYLDWLEQPGETEGYFDLRRRSLETLWQCLEQEPPSPYHKHLAIQVMQLQQGYRYLNAPLAAGSMVKHHGRILHYALKAWLFEVDRRLALPPAMRPHRVGILLPRLESSGLAARGLGWLEGMDPAWDVRLYLREQTNDPMERLYLERGYQNKLLPKELHDQIEFLRLEELDLLIFSTDFSVDHRACLLATCRLARFQLTVNNAVPTGLSAIDGIATGQAASLLDGYVAEGLEERLFPIEGSGMAYAQPAISRPGLAPIRREDLQLETNHFVFSSITPVADISPELLASWGKVLAQVPDSILMLIPFDPARAIAYRQTAFYHFVCRSLQEHGVAAERLRILHPQPFPTYDQWVDYLSLSQLYLDSFPLCQADAVCQALRGAVPVVTQRGLYPRSQLSAALLEELGRDASTYLVANTEQDYVAAAVRLGRDPMLRSQVVDAIRRQLPQAPFLNLRQFGQKTHSLLRSILEAMAAS
jgi:hypothetical protein